ncbi:MAG TPA: hypothetical protein VHP35_12150, partial [Terriglobia bacterium]|nr:hypothetical protein [Terriglobia bacterium]
GVGGLDTFGSATTVAGVVLAVLRGLLAGAAARGLEEDSCPASDVEASCVSDFCAVSTFSDSLVTGGVFWHPMLIINRPQILTVFSNPFIANVLLDCFWLFQRSLRNSDAKAANPRWRTTTVFNMQGILGFCVVANKNPHGAPRQVLDCEYNLGQ